MKPERGRLVHVESLDQLDRKIAAGARSLRGWRLSGLDLTGHSDALARLDLTGATFLGCTFAPGDAARAAAQGAIVLPRIPQVPIDAYRSHLYSAEELYDAPTYTDSLDARAYAWSQQRGDADDTLARALHDHAIDQALAQWIRHKHIVGVMGGHDAQRGTAEYGAAARLGHLLGSSHVVATGGGPGAMEAANLGAWLATRPAAELDHALGSLSAVPAFRPSIQAWADVALSVRREYDEGGRAPRSLGIPTWHYGHEPPNVFADAIAKYFRNATREAILLEVCDSGIVFLPGAGGTVQEIFQDACENYYADASAVAPMILLGRDYWTHTYPAWPLLRSLARGRVMEPHVHLVDSVDEVAALVTG